MKRKVNFGIVLLTFSFLQGCSTQIKSYHPLPHSLESKVEMPGFRNIRAWGDVNSPVLQKSAIDSIQQEMAQNHGKLKSEMNMIALSGGGADGAFGAGLICGWTQSGKRPEFKLVTGISTGALMAPFVFLGPAYDKKLESEYTSVSDKDIYQPYSLFSIFLSLINFSSQESIANNQPLVNRVNRLIDQHMLNEIAREHHKGRRLLIGTSQFNAQRLVIWDMGAIAASGSPHALALFRKIMIASASLPVSFPPQFFAVDAAGKQFNEMHVDGGIEAQVMLFENALFPFSKALPGDRQELLLNKNRLRRLYIIRNQKIHPEWDNVNPEIKAIAVHAIDSLTKSQGVGDLFRIYLYTQMNGVDYNLAYIPDKFDLNAKTPFDNSYMKKLFAIGYRLGKSGYKWEKYPPEFTPNVVTAPSPQRQPESHSS